MNYDEVEVKLVPKKGENQPLVVTLNKSNISYYRPYVEFDGNAKIKTNIYLSGSEKALTLECGYDHLKDQLTRGAEVHRLLKECDYETYQELKGIIEEYIKTKKQN